MKKKVYCFLILGMVSSQLILPAIFAHATEMSHKQNINISSKYSIPTLCKTWEYNPEYINRFFIGNNMTIFNSGIDDENGDYMLNFNIYPKGNSNVHVVCVYSDGSNIEEDMNEDCNQIDIKTKNLTKIKINGIMMVNGIRYSYNDVLKIKQNFSLKTNDFYPGETNQL